MRHKEFEGMLFYPVIRLCQLAGMEDFELADSGLTPGWDILTVWGLCEAWIVAIEAEETSNQEAFISDHF